MLLAVALPLALLACGEMTSFDGLVGKGQATDGGGILADGDGGSTDAALSPPDGSSGSTDAGSPTGTDAGMQSADASSTGVAFRGAASSVGGALGGGVTASITSPAVTAGDLLVAGAILDDPGETTSAAGWTSVAGGDLDNIGHPVRITVFYKFADSTDIGAVYKFTTGAGTALTVLIGAYSGVSPMNPIAGTRAEFGVPLSVASTANTGMAAGFFASYGQCSLTLVAGTMRKKDGPNLLADAPVVGGNSGAFGPSCNAVQGGGVAVALRPR
jgi:hypothetical protein